MALKDLVIDRAEAIARKIAAKFTLWPNEEQKLIKEIAEAIREAERRSPQPAEAALNAQAPIGLELAEAVIKVIESRKLKSPADCKLLAMAKEVTNAHTR